MTKRPIKYTSRDFESIKDSLVNYAKRYYPTTFKDFNQASFGALMLDLVAYIGDQLSFYADYQANESFLDSALEYENIMRIATQLGFKPPGAAVSTGMCSFYINVPAATSISGPDPAYLPILQGAATLTSDSGAVYTLLEDVDFSDSSNEITVSQVDSDTGVPTFFAVKAYGSVISGQEFIKTETIGDYRRFLRIPLNEPNVSEIVSIVDTQGNEYFEVPNLSQDVVLGEISNRADDRDKVKYILKTIPVPRRFVVEFDSAGDVFIQFGYGSADNLTGDLIADPSDVVLEVTGRKYISDTTFDPSNLIKTDKFGVTPSDTTLTITFRANTAETVNAQVAAINSVSSYDFSFKNSVGLTTSMINTVRDSLEVENETPILGDTSVLMPDEIRTRAYGSYAAQNRAVTRSDYVNMVYRMPSKFGRIKRVNVIQDQHSLKRNLNLYVLSEDVGGNFTVANSTLKTNLKLWLNNFRMLNDTVDILDGRIINYGIKFEVIADLGVNRFNLLQACVDKIKEKVLTVKKEIGEPVYLSDIYRHLNSVPGVIDTSFVELKNKYGGLYSSYTYDVTANLSNDGRYLVIPQNAVAEILYPDDDIAGVIK